MVYPGSATLAFVMTGEDGQPCRNFSSTGEPSENLTDSAGSPESRRKPSAHRHVS